MTCPHDVIGYEHKEGKYIPFRLEEELGLHDCIHGEKGCTENDGLTSGVSPRRPGGQIKPSNSVEPALRCPSPRSGGY